MPPSTSQARNDGRSSSGGKVAPVSTRSQSTAYRRLAQLLLVTIVVCVYGRIVTYGFVNFDDPTHLPKNPYFNPISWENLLHFWSHAYDGLYIPFSYMVFAIEGMIAKSLGTADNGGPFDPRVFHLGSLLLHAGCSLIVFQILRRSVAREMAAFAGAVVFAVHPLQVESVAWVSETRGLLSTFLSLLAIWQYQQFAVAADSSQEDSPTDRLRRGAVHYLLATTAFILAMLSKPNAVALPLIVAIIDRGILKRSFSMILRSVAPWLILAGVAAYVTKGSQPDSTIHGVVSWPMRLLIAGDALAFYMQKLLIPYPLCVDYGRSPRVVLNSPWVCMSWMVPVTAGILLLSLSRVRRYWITAAMFVVGLLPVLGFVPFKFQYISTVADRYVYLSMLGPAMAIAYLVDRSRRSTVLVGLILVAIAWSGLAYSQVKHWKDDVSLYAQVLAVNPASFLAYNNLGLALQSEGRVAEALRHFEAAVRHNPEDALAHFNAGALLHDMGYRREAMDHFRAALAIDPANAASHVRLGAILAEIGERDAGIAHFREAIEQQPDYAAAYLDLGIALYQAGRVEEALGELQRALELSPDDSHVHFALGWAFNTRKDDSRARQHFEQFLASGQENADVYNALGEIAIRAGDTKRAIDCFRHALRIHSGHPAAAANLKRALGE